MRDPWDKGFLGTVENFESRRDGEVVASASGEKGELNSSEVNVFGK